MSLLGAIVSFECVFVLFLFSGQYKADPRFEWLPCDATILMGLVNVVQGLVLLFDRRFRVNPLGVPVVIAGGLFAAHSLASLTWADGTEYAQYKAAYIATIAMWSLGGTALFVTASRDRLMRFAVLLVLFAGWIGLECIVFYTHEARFGRVMQLHAMGGESAYIGLSRVVTWGGFVCAVWWLFRLPGASRPIASKYIGFAALAAFCIVSAMIGARGPILAAVMATIFVGTVYSDRKISASLSKNGGRLLVACASIVLTIVAHKAWTGEYPLLVQRFMAFSSSSDYYDTSGNSLMRLELYSEAFWAWIERPLLGHGSGGFSLVWASVDERLFPHNLFLELLCEFGLVGTTIFLLTPYCALALDRPGWIRTPTAYKALVVGLAATALANTMTSGDIPDNRYLFAAFGLLAFRAPATIESRNKGASKVARRERRSPALRYGAGPRSIRRTESPVDRARPART